MAEEVHASTEVAGAAHHVEATALGMNAGGWVALAMLVVFGIMLYARVPRIIASALDKRIASIREQLNTATRLRAEAEALKAEYEAKSKAADADIEAIRKGAERDAAALVEQAEADAAALIARRTRMAEDRIAAAERAVIAEVRATAANVATEAAKSLITEGHGAAEDKKLVDEAIAGL